MSDSISTGEAGVADSPEVVPPEPPLLPLGAALANPAAPSPDDPFDLAHLRLNQNFSTIGVKKLLLTVPVRKPNRQVFIRVRPGEEWRLQTLVLDLKEEGEIYLVSQSLWGELGLELKPKVLFTAIDRQGVQFIWPVRPPQSDGRFDSWNRSALTAAEKAMTSWIRVVANTALGAYDVYEATAPMPDPEWRNEDFQTIVRIAFRERYIDSLDHPVIRRLRGQV
jgi:hypothetical protein